MKKLPIVISICAVSFVTICTVSAVALSACNNKQADATVNYTVSFKNYDGSLLSESKVKAGETAVYQGPTPTRADTAEFTYTFNGWDQSLENITSDCSRIAQYIETSKETTRYYTVTFQNYDGVVLTTDRVIEGGTAVYRGETPIRAETAAFSYIFKGWDQPLTNITSDCVRVATFTEIAKQLTNYYTVTFKNYDDSILHEAIVEEGGTAVYGGQTPSRPSNAEFSFAFSGWDQRLENITSDCVRIAQYDETYIEYTVRFYNDDELLYIDTVHYQETAYYRGLTPNKPSTATHSYTFIGWDKNITCISESLDVYALFSEHGDGVHINLNTNLGQENEQIEVYYDEAYDLGTPSFPGLIFLGWYAGETLIPTSGIWQYSGISSLTAKWQNVYYVFTDNGNNTYTISLNDEGKAATEVAIPAAYEGIPVTIMGTDFLRANKTIEKVSIAGSIQNIPNNSFYNCTSLSEVVLNEGLLSIGEYAFSYCSISKLIIPSTCESIGRSAFDYCYSLYHIYIPSSVTTIGAYAFDTLYGQAYICTEHISIPSNWDSNWSKYTTYTSVTKLIEGEAFNYVIRDIYGEQNVTILRLADATSKLTSYSFPSEIEGITDIRVGRYLFYNNLYIRNVDFTGISRINTNAFASCTNLESVTFSSSLTYIGSSAFRYCSSLLSVTIPDSVTEIQTLAFDSCTNLAYIYVPSSTITIGAYAFDACNKSSIYTNAHSALSGWADNWKGSQPIFYDFLSLNDADDFNYVIQSYMGDSYVTISSMKDSAKLKKSIVIPDTIEGISDIRLKSSLFNGFNELTSVDVGSGVKSIPSSCFKGCQKLANVTLHEGLTSIGSSAFYNCNKLTSINMPSSLTSIGNQAFDYCSSLTQIVIPLGVTTIGNYAFDDTGRLVFLMEASVDQPGWTSNWYGIGSSSKTFIHDYVSSGIVGDFRYAKASNGVSDTIYILGLAQGSTNVNLVVPDSIEGISNIKIASYAFDGNTLIKSVDLGHSVTAVNGYAFRSNSSLAQVIIPASCTVVRDYAFQYCSNCAIKCEVASQPSTFESNWNSSSCPVTWGYVR